MHKQGQLFEPDSMEKDLSSWNLYKGVTEDSMIQARRDVKAKKALTVLRNKKQRQIINLGIKLEKEKIPKI